MAAFAIPILVAVITGCIIRIRNMRMQKSFVFFSKRNNFLGKSHYLDSFLHNGKNGGVNNTSFLGNWMNRRKGFEKLEQYSDGENEVLDTKNGEDSNNNSGDESIDITTKPQITVLNNKTTTTTFEMDGSL